MEPVLFIHGLYNGNYGLAAEEFFPGRAVLMPDLLGYGDYTETPAGEISLTAQVDHVKGLLDAAGFGRAHVVGHSIGGAVAVLLARRYPERVASMVDVEGNFTLKDAFWSAKIAAMSPAEVEALLADQCADPAAWLVSQGIEPTTECVATAQRTLSAQLSSTLQATARSVVQITGRPEYLDDVRAILDSGLPFHLLAGNARAEDGTCQAG